jgi:hypothetical protein
MAENLFTQVRTSIEKFVEWLEVYGELSYDHQSFYAGPLGHQAKALYYKRPLLGTMAVAPMVFSEAFFPSARRVFWQKQRFPIADAHYAMGFAYMSEVFRSSKYYETAVHYLEVLDQTRCPAYQHHCWGYPFDWVTRGGTITKDTPLITTTPYVYEAYLDVYRLDNKKEWLETAHSIAEHALSDIKDFPIFGDAATCSYTPDDQAGGVINASAYRAYLLTRASVDFSDETYCQVAERNLTFVLKSQQPDGSWRYAADSVRDFVDHFHTCFVLKALAKIEKLTGHEGCREAIQKGVEYYVKNLFDSNALPKPFAKAPRLTVYRNELYDYGECINLCVLLRDKYPALETVLKNVLGDLLSRWQKLDGSFRSRKLYLGWDNVPMHRWAQSQVFRSLCFLLYREARNNAKNRTLE